MNCDTIAPWYRLLEYGAFGAALHRRRCAFLPQLVDCRKVLMLGEGDGRFLREFLKQNPRAQVDYIDKSSRMLGLAARRTNFSERVHFYHGDAVRDELPGDAYEAVITHFFLDCLSPEDVRLMLRNIGAAATKRARWIVSEFRVPAAGWQRARALLWLRVLYSGFRLVTNLQVAEIPDYAAGLKRTGFTLDREYIANFGLLTSQLWTRTTAC